MVLQTSACIYFKEPAAAMLAIRMAGLKSSLPVPLAPEGAARPTATGPTATAWLQQPQYACRLRFERQAPPAQALVSPAQALVSPEAAMFAQQPLGEETLPVELNWGCSSAVLSELEFSSEQRFLLASAWSSAAGGLKLIAQSPSLLPNKPKGAAQLLILLFSRAVRLLPSPWGGAWGAQLADGDRGLAFALPWILSPEEVLDLNAMRAALSGSVGARPKANGESATAHQLRLMRLVVAERHEMTPEVFLMAVDAALSEPPFVQGSWAQELLPPLEPPPPIVQSEDAPLIAEASAAADADATPAGEVPIDDEPVDGAEDDDGEEDEDPDELF